MNSNITVLSPSFSRNPLLRAELNSLSKNVVYADGARKWSEEELIQHLNHTEAEIAIVGLDPISDHLLTHCPKLKHIAKYGVGLNNIDREALHRHGIGLGFTPGVNKRSVSELVISFALGYSRNVFPSILKMRRGEWKKEGGCQLSNLTIGIVGLGNIGTDLAKLLRAFGSKVLFTDIIDKSREAQDFGLQYRTYEDILREADIISFHVPLTTQTDRMLDKRRLGFVKETAMIINTSRSEVVDFEACCQATQQKTIGAFAADVFPEEPMNLDPWIDCDHIFFTPHIGGSAKEAVLAMGLAAVNSVKDYLEK